MQSQSRKSPASGRIPYFPLHAPWHPPETIPLHSGLAAFQLPVAAAPENGAAALARLSSGSALASAPRSVRPELGPRFLPALLSSISPPPFQRCRNKKGSYLFVFLRSRQHSFFPLSPHCEKQRVFRSIQSFSLSALHSCRPEKGPQLPAPALL